MLVLCIVTLCAVHYAIWAMLNTKWEIGIFPPQPPFSPGMIVSLLWFCWSCRFNSVTIYYRHISLRWFLHLFQILWAAWKGWDSFPCAHSGRLPPTIKVGCTRINAKRCILPKLPKAFLSPFFSVFNNINFVFLGLSQCPNGSINWLKNLKTHESLILLSVSTFKDINVVTVK